MTEPTGILVVEDEPIVAADLKARLELLGYQVAGMAATGERALALAEQLRPGLLLMDIRLKGAMDGIEAALEIRRRWHAPIVFLTAYSEEATLERAKLAAPYGYLLKPFEDQELKTTIEIALHKHRMEEEIRHLNAELEQRVQDRTAQLLAANQELEAFSYSVSHDLRAPLRGILGYAGILMQDYGPQLEAEARRMLESICRNAGRMGQLIDDLLRFSRLSRQPMQRGPIDMTAQARAAFEAAAQLEQGRTLKFRLDALPPAQGDLAMIQQVWANLLSNAIKYTAPKKEAEIEVGCRFEHGETAYFVKDNGVGFDMKYADKLFGVFQRLHKSSEFEGTGAGLALVQRIIHRHGGRIWTEAQAHVGATFYFTLPGPSDGGCPAL